jgi:hypothetical protein
MLTYETLLSYCKRVPMSKRWEVCNSICSRLSVREVLQICLERQDIITDDSLDECEEPFMDVVDLRDHLRSRLREVVVREARKTIN